MRLKDYDASVRSTLKRGCATVEKEVVLRYGENWREEEVHFAIAERRRRWPIRSRLFPLRLESEEE